jgi:integrase
MPANLNDLTVGKFLRWCVDVQGVKPVTANCYGKAIKALWNWLAKKRVVELFPTVNNLKECRGTPCAWTEEECITLFQACHNAVGYIGDVLANQFWVAFHRVLHDSGERTGAMLALRWAWLDWKTGYLSVPAEFRKGRTQPALYPLKPQTIRALRVIYKPDQELIFFLGKRKRRNEYFYGRYRELVKSAGLPYVKRKCGPQKWRRTVASYIERAGGNATKALMHRDRRVTEDSYLDPRITDIEHENAKLFPLA